MKILITGGAGFIGSAVVRHAITAGHSVVNVDKLTYAACLDNVASIADNENYVFFQADICDRAAIDSILKDTQPDAIMHLAAESHVDRSIDGPGAFIETNVTGTYTLLEAARSYWTAQGKPKSFRFHHISTDEVYGELGSTGYFSESSPYLPNSPYSASKASSDLLVRSWFKTYDFPAIITNCSNNFGRYQYPEKLMPRMITNILFERPLTVFGNGQQVRDWLYVKDHAAGIDRILGAGKTGCNYNIGGHNVRNNREV